MDFKAKVELINELISNHKRAQFIHSKVERKEHLRNSLKKVEGFADITNAITQRSADKMLDQTFYVVLDFYQENKNKLKEVQNTAIIKKLEIK